MNEYPYTGYNPNPSQSYNGNYTPVNPYHQQPQKPMYSGSSSNYSVAYVNNENEAYSYPVGPGNTIILMDLNNNRFYMKSSDFRGYPQTMRVFEYTEVIPNHSENNGKDYVSREEFDQFKKSFAALPMKNGEEAHSEFVSREEFESLKQIVDGLAR